MERHRQRSADFAYGPYLVIGVVVAIMTVIVMGTGILIGLYWAPPPPPTVVTVSQPPTPTKKTQLGDVLGCLFNPNDCGA